MCACALHAAPLTPRKYFSPQLLKPESWLKEKHQAANLVLPCLALSVLLCVVMCVVLCVVLCVVVCVVCCVLCMCAKCVALCCGVSCVGLWCFRLRSVMHAEALYVTNRHVNHLIPEFVACPRNMIVSGSSVLHRDGKHKYVVIG